jgi:hypothetical protein
MRLRFGFVVLLFVTVAATSARAASLPEGCGNDAVQFKVKTEKGGPIPASDSNRAQLVFVQKTEGDEAGSPLSRFAVDGEWVGAVRGKSYFIVPVTPGPHKICASRQSNAQMEKANVGAIHMDAAAGKVYYFEFIIKTTEVGFLQRANGGAGGSMETSGGSTPDMTAKRHDTTDVAELIQIDELDVADAMKHAQHSVFTTK